MATKSAAPQVVATQAEHRFQPAKNDVIASVVDEIVHNYGKGRIIIAVDGEDGAGQAEFADALAAALRVGPRSVFRASMADFHYPRAVRTARGDESPEGEYKDSYDLPTFKRMLTEPFRTGWIGSFNLRAFDEKRDIPFLPVWSSGPKDAFLIVDGDFLNRPELRGIWNYSIWLETEAAPAAGAHELYEKEAKPRGAANAILNNSDPAHPRRIFADSC